MYQLCFFYLLFAPIFLMAVPLDISLTAESVILINPDNGAILYEKNAHKKMHPASTTKLATTLYALKIGKDRLEKSIAASQECVGSVPEATKQKSGYKLPSYYLVNDCSHMGIKKGEEFTLKELLFGNMIVSADDASNVIAFELGDGNINRFMDGMNGYLKSIGCNETHFNNPHGLYHPDHLTTAYDLALIAKEAIKEPLILEMSKSPRFKRPKTNKQPSTMLLQTNRLVRTGEYYYPKAFGLKTGWHSKAKHTLIAAARDNSRTLIAVLLSVKDKKGIFSETIKLFETAFNQPKIEKILLKKGPQHFQRTMEDNGELLTTYTDNDLRIEFYPAEEPSYRSYVKWDHVELPLVKGQRVGELQIKSPSGDLLKSIPLLAQNPVSESWETKIRKAFLGSKYSVLWWIALLLGLFILKKAFF